MATVLTTKSRSTEANSSFGRKGLEVGLPGQGKCRRRFSARFGENLSVGPPRESEFEGGVAPASLR